MQNKLIIIFSFIAFVGCATSDREVLSAKDQQIKALDALAHHEHKSYVDAEVKIALLKYDLAIEHYNRVQEEVMCDALRGVKDPMWESKLDSAIAPVNAMTKDCLENEPGNLCVERKTREFLSR